MMTITNVDLRHTLFWISLSTFLPLMCFLVPKGERSRCMVHCNIIFHRVSPVLSVESMTYRQERWRVSRLVTANRFGPQNVPVVSIGCDHPVLVTHPLLYIHIETKTCPLTCGKQPALLKQYPDYIKIFKPKRLTPTLSIFLPKLCNILG